MRPRRRRPTKSWRETQQYLIGSIPRHARDQPGIASFLQTAELFGLGLDYDRRLPGICVRVTLDEVRAAAAELLHPERARRRDCGAAAFRVTRREHQRRLLRRRLHADPSRPDVPGRRLSRLLRALRRHGRSRRVRRRGGGGRRRSWTPTGDVYDPEIFIRLHAAHHRRRWAAPARASSAPRARSTTSGRRATTSRCTRTCPTCCARCTRDGVKIGLISNTQRCLASFEAHFELDGLFAVAISSSDHGYMKPHPSIFEAALRQVGVAAARGGDGRRQPRARHRGRAQPRHARRARLARRHGAGVSRSTCPSSDLCASFNRCFNRGASPLGLPCTRTRAPLRRRAPVAWLARNARSRPGTKGGLSREQGLPGL